MTSALPFTLDPAAGRLASASGHVMVSQDAVRVLAHLLATPGEVVERDVLLSAAAGGRAPILRQRELLHRALADVLAALQALARQRVELVELDGGGVMLRRVSAASRRSPSRRPSKAEAWAARRPVDSPFPRFRQQAA